MADKVILNLDESGNLGKQGKYFTIACIETTNLKPLNNVMKKAILKTKREFPEFKRYREIKASDSNPPIKDYFLRKIVSKDNINIRYIVSDKEHVKKELLDDENLLYNYMLQYLVVPVATRKEVKELEINIDKRTIKVKSINSFEEYIKIKLNYEMNLGVKVKVNYLESHNSYAIQASDFVANVVNAKYEHNYDYYYDLLQDKIIQSERFPYRLFGTNKVINI